MRMYFSNTFGISDETRAAAEARNRALHDRREPHVVWSDERREWLIREWQDGRWKKQMGRSPTGKPFVRGFSFYREAERSLNAGYVQECDAIARSNYERQALADKERAEQRDRESALASRREAEWREMSAAADAVAATLPRVDPALVVVHGPDDHRAQILRVLADRPYLRHVCTDTRRNLQPVLYGSEDGLEWHREIGDPGEGIQRGEYERCRQIGERATVVEAWELDPRDHLDDLKRVIRQILGLVTPSDATESAWPQHKVDRMSRLWLTGFTASEIGAVLGVSRNAVIGKAGRTGLPRRTREECQETLSRALAAGLLAFKDEALLTEERRADLMSVRPKIGDAAPARTAVVPVREGQADFRADVVENHGMRCCVTGVDVPRVLQAAHLAPYAVSRDHSKANGLMMRADLHLLFDDDLVCIDPRTMTLMVSSTLDGTDYAELRGRTVDAPGAIPPDPIALAWRQDRFRTAEIRRAAIPNSDL